MTAEPLRAMTSREGLIELAERVLKRVTPEEIPSCPVCGRTLRVQSATYRETFWGCDGLESDPDEPGHLRRAPGYVFTSTHYEMSRYLQKRYGDDEVESLCNGILTALRAKAAVEER